MRAGKGPKTAVANRKLASGKSLLESSKLVQDELTPGSPEVRNLENSSDQNVDNIRLPPVKASKRPKIGTVNRKPASSKLSLALTKVALRIGQDVRAKKILTLKTG